MANLWLTAEAGFADQQGSTRSVTISLYYYYLEPLINKIFSGLVLAALLRALDAYPKHYFPPSKPELFCVFDCTTWHRRTKFFSFKKPRVRHQKMACWGVLQGSPLGRVGGCNWDYLMY